jgi:tetratricopeptide (TPR) repeat protein
MRDTRPDHSAGSIDGLADEFARKCRDGNAPSITYYADRYPHLAKEIEDVFPAIAAMEQYCRREDIQRADTRRRLEIDQQLLDRLGDYRIVREVGRGGMGVVYEAIQESLGRTVALKVLTANVTHAPKQLARFKREAQAAAILHHTNIVPIFGVGSEDGLHYYVMQYIDGVGLDRLIDGRYRSPTTPASSLVETGAGEPSANDVASKQRPFSWQRIASYAVQIAHAVSYAHKQGVLHRDIKPANLLVDQHDTVWVTDFGLAKVFGDEALTQSGDVFGTIRYMAPEQFEGQSTSASDIYSIGVTLYELATGQPAFTERDAKQLVRSITQQGVPRPRLVARHIPRDLETIILKAAAFNPRHRYSTASELAEDLQRFCDGEPIAARRASAARRLWRWSCRNPALAALTGLSAMLLMMVAIVASIGWIRVEDARQDAIRLADRERQRAAELRVATALTQQESDRAHQESQRAENNLHLAMQAFEEVIQRVSSRGLPESLELDLEDEAREMAPALFTDDDAELLQSLLSFYEAFARQNEADQSVQLQTAKAHHRIGDIRQSLGQFDQAADAYDDALEIYQDVTRDNKAADVDILTATVEAWNQRGVAFIRTARVREAAESHLQALSILQNQPISIAETATCRFALAETYNHLGALWYRADGTGFPIPWRVTEPRLANVITATASRPQLLDWMDTNYRSALQLLEQLLQEQPQNEQYRLALARCHRNYLPLARHGGSAEQAAECLALSAALLQQLATDFPDTPRYAFELADVLSINTPELRDTEFGETSWQRLEHAEQIARQLSNSFPNQPEYKTLYANALYRLGLILEQNGQSALAIRHLDESVRHFQELLERFPTTPAYVISLGRVAIDLGALQREAGLFEQSYETLDNAFLRVMATYQPDADLRTARRTLAMLQLSLTANRLAVGRGQPTQLPRGGSGTNR